MTVTSEEPKQGTLPEVPEAKPTPFVAAKKVIVAAQLDAVRFRAVSARALEASDDISPDVPLAASTHFLRPTVVTTSEGFSTTTTLVFRLGSQSAGEEGATQAYGVVQATLEAVYKFKSDAPSFSGEELKDFALCYCPFHVWGYWREFVQSSLARLDLPQLTIPLFLIDQAPRMVQDRLE